ncbi:MAG: enoyl-CoA hydratase/isomerase family protein [Rhodobacteraceae bacterium]|nr:enoyl-CoA hydratase/isomerase family protein [Paracoccaceae bacterium]
MSDIHIRRDGALGRITLNRPDALNALTHQMCLDIDAALVGWADDPNIRMLLIEGEGRSFCAGGDITEMYRAGLASDFTYGQRFWRDEYRMNARLFEFPKPVASFLQGFTMGGGVGVGCHASHRIVAETSKIAIPEVGIGLVPDVGGSLLLAQAPGRCGEYLGLTADRMGPADAVHAGFADYVVPQDRWDALKAALVDTGDWTAVDAVATDPGASNLAAMQPAIDTHFGGETFGDIMRSLETDDGDFSRQTRGKLARIAPLSLFCATQLIHRVRVRPQIRYALIVLKNSEIRASRISCENL